MKQVSDFRRVLCTALESLPEDLAPEQLDQLEEHWRLVYAWNRRVNLTAISSDSDAAWLHYRDSLEAARFLDAGPVLDIGSGAGFPGIPLAVARPGHAFTLVEPRRKRASFLRAVVSRLGLQNACVVQARAGDRSVPSDFAVATTRATFPEGAQLATCLKHVRVGGRLLVFRAKEAHPTEGPHESHAYWLRNTRRVIQIWTLVESSTK